MISVVIPCYNEYETLPLLRQRIHDVAIEWLDEYEIIIVDDGSDEKTWDMIERICQQEPNWRAVRFSRNFGHQAAVSAGLAHARGDAVMVMDADLQDPPELLSEFVLYWREGYEVVYAVRRKRKENIFKRACYHTFYRLLGKMSRTPIPLDSGDFCLMDRKVVDILNKMPEHNRFVRGLRAWAGFRQIGVEYERDARAAGEPKYSLRKLLILASDGLLAFSTAPLRLATCLGFLVSTFAFLGAVFTLLQKIFASQFAQMGLEPVPGFATIVISVMFLGGVQMICLGIIGEYLGRIYDEVKARPQWIVREVIGARTSRETKPCELELSERA